MSEVQFTLNGVSTTVETRPGETLLETLRTRCGIKSTKDGCQPQGQCGCCLTLIDGRPKVSCVTRSEKTAGKDVLTLEGVDPAERELFAKAFVAAAGLQCGFCIPGIVLRGKHLLDKNPDPSRDEIAKAIDGHLCRCTGYVRIVDAIEMVAKAKRGEAPVPEPLANGGVGTSYRRVDARELTLGERDFIDDMNFPGMLHGAVVISPHPRAKVLSIDTSKAEAMPGVEAVVTYRDVPGQRWYGMLYPDWPGLVAVGEEVRCVGDFLAAVAAVDEHTAREAAKLVEVEYEVLEPVLDMEAALKEGAPRVNPVGENQLSRTFFDRGDVDAALAASVHVVSGDYTTQRIEHLFLEPESAIALIREDGKLHLYTQGQGVFDDRRQVAAFLGLPEEQVFVELVPNGGAFGGKEDMSIQAHASLLCWVTKKPVRVTLNREESVRIHPKRHPLRMKYTVGCDAEGRLTALKAFMVGDTGAYASVGGKVLERAAGHGCGPYRVANARIEGIAARTNNPPCGAMRGFGANQSNFAVEGCLDRLALKAGLDGWEMRWRNAVEIGDMFSTGQVLDKSVGVKKTLLAVKDEYYAALKAGKAVGISCGMKNSGIGNGAIEWGKCRLVVEEDLSITLYNGFTEMGQGLLTILAQCASEASGVPSSTFRPKVDATFALQCGQTTGSRATMLGGNAAIAAGEKLKAALEIAPLSEMVGRIFAGDVKIDDTTRPGADVEKIKTHTAFGYATQVCILDGEGKLEHFIAAHDVGKAINPDLCSGQIEGAVHMGLGFALSEELPCHNGMPVTFKLREIGVMRARDMPTVKVHIIEEHEPEGPYGAKGVGEIGLVPTAGAVASALAMFDGEHRYTLPMKDSPAGKAISVGRIRSKTDRTEWR